LLVVDLDELARADAAVVEGWLEALATTLRVTVGVARRHPPAALDPLLSALTCSLLEGEADLAAAVAVPDLDAALAELTDAVGRAPQASVALAALLRQTAELASREGLAAEAAVYSTLLGGAEFREWLSRRPAAHAPEVPGRLRVRVERDGAALVVTLARAEQHNAFDARMREELYDALLLATLDGSIARVELRGEGPSFCSGGDLAEFGAATDLAAAYLVRLERAPWRLLDAIRDRVHVRVHGATIGAGIEIAAFAGRVTASPEAFFELPEVGMGLIPGAGGTVSIPRRIGRWRAAWLMLTGRRVGAETALRWGLVDAGER
jgi:enoyl-CoA hydratase/carnithine racemase